FFTYLWSNRATDSTITVSPPYSTAYSVTITDDCGNQVKDNIRVRISEPQARFNYEYIDEKLLRFGNFSKGEIKNVWWYFGNGDTTTVYEPLYSYPIPNTYQVKLVIEDIYGCFDSTFLEIQEPLQYFPPTAFSPNGDG